MNYKQISEQLLTLLGGKANITSNAACMTRLRVGLRDTSKADIEGVKKVEGVLGVVESDTLQIVFGPGKVNKVLDEFYKLTGLPKGQAENGSDQDIMKLQRKIKLFKRQNMINRYRDF